MALIYPAFDQALGLNQLIVVVGLLIFVLLALGFNIALGFVGLLDLGYAACFAVGAYTSALLSTSRSIGALGIPGSGDFLVVLALSGGAAALFGALNGALTIRLRGDYLAIVTLALGQMVPLLLLNLNGLTSGARGISLPPPSLLGYRLGGSLGWYYLLLALVLLVAAACTRLRGSRMGRAWAALSDDETAAASCGVYPAAFKTLALMLSATVAGVAGACFANIFGYVDPSQFEFRVSAMVLAMVVIGGAGSVGGVMIGALLVAAYDQLAIPLLGAWLSQLTNSALDLRGLNFLSFGLALYVTVLVRGRMGRR